MSAADLNRIKLNLIAWIHQLSDIDLLTFLDSLKNTSSKKEWWDELNDTQQKIILKGIKDADEGKLISSENFWKKIKDA